MEPEFKKKRVLLACNRCKQRKKRCDGILPNCGGCVKSKRDCIYGNTSLQIQQSHINMQVSRLDHLEVQFNSMVEEMKLLRHDIVNSQINEFDYSMKQVTNKLSFMQPIINLAEQPSTHELYIGQSAVISKVQAIRKILTNDQELEITRNPLIKVKFDNKEFNQQQPTKELEDIFFQCYIQFSRNRYHFIEKSSLTEAFNMDPTHRSDWEIFMVNICLANGCRISQLCKLTTQFQPKYYFEKSLKILGKLQSLSSMQQIQAIMLLALYLHYAYDYLDPWLMNVWELSGLAIRKLIQLGYHKKKLPMLSNCLQIELEKRLFWSIYAFDKLLSLSLGRPSSISDLDIDVPFPLSLEEVGHDENFIFNLQNQQLSDPLNFKLPVTSITYLIESCRIRQIEGQIDLLAYNEKKLTTKDFEQVNQLLENWIKSVPPRKEFNEGTRNEVPYDYILLSYQRAKLFLLLPQLTQTNLNDDERELLILSTLKSAGGICKIFQKIYKDALFGFSIYSLHTIFLAGVTLVYCIWTLGNPPHIKAHNDIRACSNLLYSFSERTNEGETYRVLFENLTEKILYNTDVSFEKTDNFMNNLLDDNNFLNITIDDDFWKRLDFT